MSDFLNDIKQFSPQELEEFKAQVESNEDAASVFEGQVSSMDANQRAELESIMTGQPKNDAHVPEAQESTAQRKALESTDQGHYNGTVTENIHGMAQAAVSQLPFGEKILAAGEAAYDVATGEATSLKEAYADNMVENLEQTREFSEEHQYLDLGARAVSEMGQLWMGGALVKGGLKAANLTSKAAKAGQAVKNIPILGKLAPKYGQMAVLEGTLQTARDLDMEGKVTLQQGVTTLGGNLALAATFGKLGDLAESGLKGAAGVIAKTPAGEQLNRMRTNLVKNISTFTLDNSLNKINKFVNNSQNTLNPHIKLRNSDEYFELVEAAYKESGVLPEVVESWGAKNIDNAIAAGKKAHESIKASKDIALNKLHKLGKTPEAIISDADALDLVSSLHDSIDYSKLSDQAKGMVGPIQEKLMRMARKSGADLYNFVNAANHAKMPGSIKKELDQLIKLDPSFQGGIEKFLMQARKTAYDKMEDAATVAFKSGDDEALGVFNDFVKYNKMNRVMDHNLNKVVDSAQGALLREEMGRGAVSSAVHKTLNDMRKEVAMLGLASVGLGGVQYATGIPVLPLAAGSYAVPKLIKHFRNAPESVGKLGRKVLQGMEAEGDNVARELNRFYKLSDYLEKTADMPLIQSSVVSFLNASREVPEYERFNKLYATAKAASHFASNPLERNTASVIENRQAISDLLSQHAPDLRDQLNEAIESGENIGPIMDVIIKMPEAAPLVKDGVGFEGKVYNEEDKLALEKELANNLFVPGDYKIQMMKDLRENGTIPDIEAVPKRQPKKYEKRSKRRPY